ncbi:DinB family protein [uncultured Jatrophihabitans sp.]|uniref:mycothiol transferase n=1 Tax=uncultured Jatrophihabitans sp. TaxID=1610747 RepID=UPI0035C95535
MTTVAELLADAFERARDTAAGAVEGLSEEQLTARVDGDANSIAWLVWHLARVQDDHVADLAGAEQRWTAAGWSARFGLPFDDGAIGYGQSSDEVGQVRGVSADDLVGYLDDVHAATSAYVRDLDDDALDRIVDDAWDPPVTVAVRLVSVVNDDTQHAGQAAFVRGIVERTGG